jgi:hypothetical protein
VKKAKDGSVKNVGHNYIIAPKLKKGTDYIVRGGLIYVSEDLISHK